MTGSPVVEDGVWNVVQASLVPSLWGVKPCLVPQLVGFPVEDKQLCIEWGGGGRAVPGCQPGQPVCDASLTFFHKSSRKKGTHLQP